MAEIQMPDMQGAMASMFDMDFTKLINDSLKDAQKLYPEKAEELRQISILVDKVQAAFEALGEDCAEAVGKAFATQMFGSMMSPDVKSML